MPQTFRIRRLEFFAYLAAALMGAVFIAFGIFPFFVEDAKQYGYNGPHSVAIVGWMGILVGGALFLAGAYGFAKYFLGYIAIDEVSLAWRGVFKTYGYQLVEIQKARWDVDREQISIWLPGEKCRVDFSEFAPPVRLQLIRCLHNAIPAEKQENWLLFCHKAALPLYNVVTGQLPVPPAPNEILVTRKNHDRFFAVATIVVVGMAIIVGELLPFPIPKPWMMLGLLIVMMLGAWAAIRWGTPRQGSIEKKVGVRYSVLILAVYLIPILIWFIPLPRSISEHIWIAWAIIGISSIGCAIVMIAATKYDKRNKQTALTAAPASVTRWDEIDFTQFDEGRK